jgi:predicted AlkP superfamily phosphohydrolase/phosphomutase
MSDIRHAKVLVLGIDGISPDILEPLMEGGRAPHFAQLRETGAYWRVQTTTPSQSPVAWSTIATGANAGHHGVFDFLRRNPKKYLPELAILRVNPRNIAGRRSAMFLPVRQGTPFWQVASEAGLPATVIRWPLTLPPEEVSGRMLAGLGVPDLKANLGRYTVYTTAEDFPTTDDPKGEVVRLEPGDTLSTEFQGPEGASPVPLSIAVDGDAAAVVLTVGDQDVRLEEGTWSERVRLSFSLRLRKPVAGQCRFYLTSADPLKLYLSPVEVDPREPAFIITHPDGYAAELAAAIGDYHTLGMPEDTNALGDGVLDSEGFLALCDDVMAEREAMLWHELDRFEGGLLAFVFDTSDRIQHVFWGAHDPTEADDPAFVERYRGAIQDFYCRMDALLGKVMERLDDETALVVLSDHGFSAFRRAVHLNSWLVENGYMTLKDSSERESTLFRNVRWRKTRAYAVGFSSIYLNLRRREGRGVVHPRDAGALKQEIGEKLLALEDPQTGERVLEAVYRSEDVFHGPLAEDAPDLVVGFKPGYRTSWQTAIGGCPEGLIEDNDEAWCGDHLCDGSFVPGILFLDRPSDAASAHLRDVAPTVLRLLGLAPPQEMDGTPLVEG